MLVARGLGNKLTLCSTSLMFTWFLIKQPAESFSEDAMSTEGCKFVSLHQHINVFLVQFSHLCINDIKAQHFYFRTCYAIFVTNLDHLSRSRFQSKFVKIGQFWCHCLFWGGARAFETESYVGTLECKNMYCGHCCVITKTNNKY